MRMPNGLFLVRMREPVVYTRLASQLTRHHSVRTVIVARHVVERLLRAYLDDRTFTDQLIDAAPLDVTGRLYRIVTLPLGWAIVITWPIEAEVVA